MKKRKTNVKIRVEIWRNGSLESFWEIPGEICVRLLEILPNKASQLIWCLFLFSQGCCQIEQINLSHHQSITQSMPDLFLL